MSNTVYIHECIHCTKRWYRCNHPSMRTKFLGIFSHRKQCKQIFATSKTGYINCEHREERNDTVR